jgi:hypothetical protein
MPPLSMLLLFFVLLQISPVQAQTTQLTYCASTTAANVIACSNTVNNGGSDPNRCFYGTCNKCRYDPYDPYNFDPMTQNGPCQDSYAPQCGHNFGPGCYIDEKLSVGPVKLWPGEADASIYYQYWRCAEKCEETRLCHQPGSCDMWSIKVDCGGSNEGYCKECKACGPGLNWVGGCYNDIYGNPYDSSCEDCAAGYYNDEERNGFGCKWCMEGTYSQAGATACEACSAGTYQPFMLASNCDACPEGTYQTNTGASFCEQCTACPVGYYRTACGGASAGECAVCTNTKYEE